MTIQRNRKDIKFEVFRYKNITVKNKPGAEWKSKIDQYQNIICFVEKNVFTKINR